MRLLLISPAFVFLATCGSKFAGTGEDVLEATGPIDLSATGAALATRKSQSHGRHEACRQDFDG